MNCWEYKKCGRQKGGVSADALGVCPAYTEKRLNGIHGGINAGRACWVIAGTFCSGEVQGTFAIKLGNCQKCDFYGSEHYDKTYSQGMKDPLKATG